jgi:prevent-host-death family protein
MRELVISVTQAARKFADCINRVRYQGVSFVLNKNGVPVARIVPVESASGADLERLAVALREAREEADQDHEAAERLIADPEEITRSQRPQSPTILAKRPTLNW